MINYDIQVYEGIKSIFPNISEDYPQDWAIYPAISYTEETNTTLIKTDGTEKTVLVKYKIDIWDKKKPVEAVEKVDNVMNSLGFYRVGYNSINEPGLKHIVLRYEATHDTDYNRLFRK